MVGWLHGGCRAVLCVGVMYLFVRMCPCVCLWPRGLLYVLCAVVCMCCVCSCLIGCEFGCLCVLVCGWLRAVCASGCGTYFCLVHVCVSGWLVASVRV